MLLFLEWLSNSFFLIAVVCLMAGGWDWKKDHVGNNYVYKIYWFGTVVAACLGILVRLFL